MQIPPRPDPSQVNQAQNPERKGQENAGDPRIPLPRAPDPANVKLDEFKFSYQDHSLSLVDHVMIGIAALWNKFLVLIGRSDEVPEAKAEPQPAKREGNAGLLDIANSDLKGESKNRDIADAQYKISDRMLQDPYGSVTKEAQKTGTREKYLLAAANNGHSEAQYDVAQILKKRGGIENSVNRSLVKEWLEKAAEQNHPKAQSELRELEANYGSENGRGDRQLQLGIEYMRQMYKFYSYFPKDQSGKAATEWIRKAHESGNMQATCILADIYASQGKFDDAKVFLTKLLNEGKEGTPTDFINKRLGELEGRKEGDGKPPDKAIWANPFV